MSETGLTNEKLPEVKLSSELDEDVVAEDLMKAKSTLRKISSQLKSFIKPISQPARNLAEKGSVAADSVVSESFYKKAIKPISIVMLVIILFFIAIRVVIYLKNISESGENLSTTPTPFEHVSFQKSVYADDPEVKLLQEAIKVLENEIKSTPLDESTLKPPRLDFSVSF